MADKGKASKDNLLDELESLRGMLESEIFGDEDSVPTLVEVVDDDIPLLTRPHDLTQSDADGLLDETEDSATELVAGGQPPPLPGQQSLFDQAGKPEPAAKKKPLGENPFLPKHIRDRLTASHKALEASVSASQALPEKKTATATHDSAAVTEPAPKTIADQAPKAVADQVLDELIAEYLPKLEQALRQRLRDALAAAGDGDRKTRD